MAKTPSDYLFRLIKSLSGPEKRYFRLRALKAAELDTLYIKLFEIIVAAPEFDDAAFRRKLYSPKYRSESKKYPVLKAYLYDLILESLQFFDHNNSVIHTLNHLLQSVAVLFKRGLYQDCAPLLAKAEKLAAHYEHYSYLLEVMDWRKQLAYTRADIDYLDKELQRIHTDEQRVIYLQTELLAAKQAFFNILLQVRRDAKLTPETEALLLKSSLENKQGKRAEIFRRRSYSLYLYAKRDNQGFFQCGGQLLEFMEQHPHFLRESLTEYIAALSNYILACGLIGRYDLVEKSLQKMRDLKPKTLDDRIKIHKQYYSNRFALCVFSGQFDSGRALIAAHKQESEALQIPKYESDISLVQYFLIYFGCGDYDSALDCLNQWMNQPRSVSRQDIQSLVRVLNLLVHYEQGNIFLLEYKLRGTERHLRSRKSAYTLERLFVRLIHDLIKTDAHRARVEERMRAAYQELSELLELPEVKTVLQTFDFLAWLKAKAEGISFAQAVQKKFKETGHNSGSSV